MRRGRQVRFDVDMGFKPYQVVANEIVCDDITVVTLDGDLDIRAGEYVFVWVPGVGEKPFSCLTHDPVRLAVINVGPFTDHCYQLSPEMTRCTCVAPTASPWHRQKMRTLFASQAVPVWPRCTRSPRTSAALSAPLDIFVGARTANRLYFRDECERRRPCHHRHR